MCVSVHTHAHGDQRWTWTERGWDPDDILTSSIDYYTKALITEGLLGGFARLEKQAEGCLWKACPGLQLLPLF